MWILANDFAVIFAISCGMKCTWLYHVFWIRWNIYISKEVFFQTGQSIMVDVATGGDSSTGEMVSASFTRSPFVLGKHFCYRTLNYSTWIWDRRFPVLNRLPHVRSWIFYCTHSKTSDRKEMTGDEFSFHSSHYKNFKVVRMVGTWKLTVVILWEIFYLKFVPFSVINSLITEKFQDFLTSFLFVNSRREIFPIKFEGAGFNIFHNIV